MTGNSQALPDTIVKRFVACCLLCKTCAYQCLREDDAPASAYLRAAPDCNLTFVKPGREDPFESYRWYCCSYCHTHQIPLEFHVGDVFSSDPTNLKPVVDSEWDMQKPEPVAAVRNTYVTEQVSVSLAGLFSTAVRDAGFAQWKHVQGEVNAIHITSLTGTTMGFLASLHAGAYCC